MGVSFAYPKICQVAAEGGSPPRTLLRVVLFHGHANHHGATRDQSKTMGQLLGRMMSAQVFFSDVAINLAFSGHDIRTVSHSKFASGNSPAMRFLRSSSA